MGGLVCQAEEGFDAVIKWTPMEFGSGGREGEGKEQLSIYILGTFKQAKIITVV